MNKIVTEIEMIILSTLINKPESYNRVFDLLKPSFFQTENNRIIFAYISEAIESEQQPDYAYLFNQFRKHDNNVELTSILVSIMSTRIELINLEANCIFLKENYFKNQIRNVCSNVLSKINNDCETNEAISDFESLIDLYQLNNSNENDKNLSELLPQRLNEFQKIEIALRNGKSYGIPSGLTELDRITGGWQRGDLIILAARPSMGKTAMSLFYARKSCEISQTKALVFSLEMSINQITDRILLSEAVINQSKIRSGELSERDWNKLNESYERINKYEIVINDSTFYVEDIVGKTKQLVRKNKCDVVFIDYLTLIDTYKSFKTDNSKIEYITRKLKMLAKTLNIPVILLSQLNRNVENRADKRPQLSDLRNSGAIEQDADIVIFYFRPDYYDRDSVKTNEILTILSKHRNGSLAELTHKYDETISNFYNESEFNEMPF